MVISEAEADWRHATVGRVKGDQEIHGGIVKDGTLLWLTTVTLDQRGAVSFPTPSPAAMAFSLAFDAARAAVALRSQVNWIAVGKDERQLDPSSIATLYAHFEQAMAAAVFSFQCVEAYANQTIARLAAQPMDVVRRKGTERLTPAELERHLSTDDKLTQVLPRLLNVQSPKGRGVWAGYRDLKEVRDSTVHLKSADHYVRGKIDKETLYYRLLNRTATIFPRTAAHVVRYFSGNTSERWLEAAEARLSRLGAATT